MNQALVYAQYHQARFCQQLNELLRIPSISTSSQHATDVHRAAQWLLEDMERIGLSARLIQSPPGLPLVYGEWLGAGTAARTVLIYGHYDVQPADYDDNWYSDPFQPLERDGKIYARGAVDSKSHVIIQLKAIESLIASGNCPINIKILFEGEEESGSEHIFRFVRENSVLLSADVCVVSDGSMPRVDQPVLVYGLRGIISMELILSGPQRDLHSGHYGGSVHNPIQALSHIIAQFHDATGWVRVPGFYDAVRPLDKEERALLAPMDMIVQEEWRSVADAPAVWGETDYSLLERIGARPTLEINGIIGGFTGEGFKTIIPSRALAKISCRLVPDQDPDDIYAKVAHYIAEHVPPTMRYQLRQLEEGSRGILLDRKHPVWDAVVAAYTHVWGKKPLFTREGGSIPVVSVFQKYLNAPIIMMPFGYKGGGAHGPNEYVVLDMFYKGIQTMIYFAHEFATLAKTI